MTDDEQISEWLSRNKPTRCRTVYVLPCKQLTKDPRPVSEITIDISTRGPMPGQVANGLRKMWATKARNGLIRSQFRLGSSIEELSRRYQLGKRYVQAIVQGTT